MNSKRSTLTRRSLLRHALAVGVGASLWQQQLLAALSDPLVLKTFTHGVASGEPSPHGVLLWTRITPSLVTSASQDELPVQWRIASDAAFDNVVQQGVQHTHAGRDYTVKVSATGLQPNTRYYYQFNVDGIWSEPGRTKTLAAEGLESLSLAVVSCSNYPFGFFNVYDAIAQDDEVDVVVHLGDYIYEYGVEGWGGDVGEQLGRDHQPVHEIVTLDDYRQRHAQYKQDMASRKLHAAHPIIPIWDDHESANNPYMEGAQNHNPGEGKWSDRREASLRAYFEWMPVADPAPHQAPAQLWRVFDFGGLATMVTLETRHTGRSLQIDYAEHLPKIASDTALKTFQDEVLWDASRTMLSDDMSAFYQRAIARSKQHKVPWRIVANQIPMARTHVPNIDALVKQFPIDDSDPMAAERAQFAQLGRWGLPLYTDTWDGYPVAREAFYALNRHQGVQDLLVITGDSHSFWANRLADKQGRPMGVEIGTAGVTSPGDFEAYGPDAAKMIDTLLAEQNPEVVWTDNQHRGFIKLTLTKTQATAAFNVVDTVKSRRYKLSTLRAYDIVKRQQSLDFLS